MVHPVDLALQVKRSARLLLDLAHDVFQELEPPFEVPAVLVVAVVDPAGIVTVAGTATCTSLLLRLTVAPSAGAAELMVSVPIVG